MKGIAKITQRAIGLALVLQVVPLALAQQDLVGFEQRRVMVAARLNVGETIELDGRLDEAVWARAEPASDFVQIDPENGTPATEPTEVFVVFDANNMYMGVVAYDSAPNELRGNTMERDAFLSADDRFMWVFDPYLDERTGYFFEMNPSGAMGDSLIGGSGPRGGGGFLGGGPGGGGGGGREWDGIWDAQVRRSEIGWTIEIRMPFRTLNFDPNAQAWGINFQRTVRRKNEETIWNGYQRNGGGLQRMANAGLVVGISEVSQGVGLDVRPFVTGRAQASPGIGADATLTGDAGVDFIYSVTPSLRANFTLDTDFAETEVDDRQVNLTRFPLRFPEKRAFFLEGSNFFGFDGFGDAFFSRRIGLNDGQPQRIDYGVKLTGQVGAHDMGFLQVRTGQEGARLGEDFTVFRGTRRFSTESHAGMIYTHRTTRLGPVTDSTAARPGLHTLGFDMNLASRTFLGNRDVSLDAHYIRTTNPDDTGNNARYGSVLRYFNDLLGGRVGFIETQKNFDPAVGFIDRVGTKDYDAFIRFSPRPSNHPLIRQFRWSFNIRHSADPGNVMLTQRLNFGLFDLSFHSGDRFGFTLVREFERLDEDFEMGPGDSVVLPEGNQYRFNSYQFQWDMSDQRPLALGGQFRWGGYLSGTRRDFEPRLSIRPRNGLLINLENEWTRIELPEGSFSVSVFQGQVSAQFGPWISLANNIQYDSDSRTIGLQTRFRWILNPGNDLFLVYGHNWLSDPAGGVRTVDRKLASKLVYTHRF